MFCVSILTIGGNVHYVYEGGERESLSARISQMNDTDHLMTKSFGLGLCSLVPENVLLAHIIFFAVVVGCLNLAVLVRVCVCVYVCIGLWSYRNFVADIIYDDSMCACVHARALMYA